jgi:hypothetical protein
VNDFAGDRAAETSNQAVRIVARRPAEETRARSSDDGCQTCERLWRPRNHFASVASIIQSPPNVTFAVCIPGSPAREYLPPVLESKLT